MRDFFRPVATLLTGTVLAQGLVYASRPLLTRLYTPDDFGVLSFFAGLVAVVASAAGGKFDDALMLPRDSHQSWSLASTSMILSLVAACVVALLLPLRHFLEPVVSSRTALEILAIAPLSIVFIGVSRTCDAWLTRQNRFDRIARGRVVQSATTVPAQITGGFVRAEGAGLVGGLVLGQAVQAVYYGIQAHAARRSVSVGPASLKSMFRAASRYRRFALFGAPAAALNTASVQLPALILLFFFDPSVLGNYGVGYSVLAVPMTLIGSAVSQVYYVRATEALRDNRLDDLTGEVFRRLVALGLFPILSVAIAGPELFRFVFGSSWGTAGLYAGFLSPWVFLVFISSPLSRLFDLLEKQRQLLAFNVVLLVVRGAALYGGGKTGDAATAILLFGVAGATMWLIHTVWMLHLAGVRFRKAIAALSRCAGLAVIPMTLVLGVKSLGSDLWTTAGVVVAAGAYYFALLKLDPTLLHTPSDDRT